MFNEDHRKYNKSIWTKFGKEVNGIHELELHTLYGRITYEVHPWEVVLDTFARPRLPSRVEIDEYTRIRAPYTNHNGFVCEIYESKYISEISKFFGMQDVEIGDKQFDKRFIVKSNNEINVWRLLKNDRIRKLILNLPNVNLKVSSDKRIFSSVHPDARNEIILEIDSIISDLDVLRELSELMLLLLNTLCKIDTECKNNLP